MNRLVFGVVVVVLASGAHAMEPGDNCKLKNALTITINRAGGVVEEPLDEGTVVELISVSDQNGIARVRSGEVKGNVPAVDLESACTGTLRICTLSSPIIMYEQNRSDSKSWRVKPGADMSILKKGKTWAAVRVGDLQGFAKTDEVGPACAAKRAAPDATGGGDDTAPTTSAPTTQESVDRGDGPGVLFLPFGLDGTAPASSADALADILWERLAYYRPDAARLGLDTSPRDKPWKELVAASAKRAHGVETAYVIVGRLSVEAPSKDAPLDDKNLLQLAVVDAKTGHVLKGVRVRPTTKASDPWAEKVLADLLPAVATAPGSKVPAKADKLETPAPQPAPAPTPAKHTDATPYQSTPWFANGWGYAALASTALFGAGSGVAGRLALDDNTRANDTAQIDPRRATLRNTALGEAITADSLGVVAVGAGVATVVVFATRAGISD